MADTDDRTAIAGRYTLCDLLGEGGMGTVWMAHDKVLGRMVALKQLRLGGLPAAEQDVARERTMREARIAASLNHPNVVSIYDVVVENGDPWLVMEYVPSVSLGDLLRERGTLPVRDVAAIGAQVAAALAAAHLAGIVHRDVKPDNVLVANGMAKLVDFGISHVTGSAVLTRTGLLTGTPAYLAPETADGRGNDQRSDTYALGATLYAAVEGAPPFGTDPNLLALLARVGRGGAPPPRHAGPLTDVLSRLLADDPAARPTAVEAHRALSTLATAPGGGSGTAVLGVRPEEPTIVVAPPHPPRLRRVPRVAVLVVVGVLLLGAGAGAVAWLVTAREAPPTALPSNAPATTTPATGPAATAVFTGIRDPRTADPCSLLDAAALRRYGSVTVDAEANVAFSQCRAFLVPGGGDDISVFTQFLGVDRASAGASEQIGTVTVTRFPPAASSCERRLTLADGNEVSVVAERYDSRADDLCTTADTASLAAAAMINSRGVGTRSPLDTDLTDVDPCSLLTPSDLATLPGAGGPGMHGFAAWSCDWVGAGLTYASLHYYRGERSSSGVGTIAIEIDGRDAGLVAGDGVCAAYVAQRGYLNQNGIAVTEQVQLSVYGSEPVDVLCDRARTLVTAAAGRLPPPP